MLQFIYQSFTIFKNWIFSKFFNSNKFLFCYGSNSIKQLQERLNIKNIKYTSAFIDNYSRIFAGSSKKWQNGGIASIFPEIGSKVYGILVEIDNEKLKVLDTHEGGYYRDMMEVRRGVEKVKAYVYIKRNNEFMEFPSINYLEAIDMMLNDRGIKEDRVILIKGVVNNRLRLLGKWKKEG